MVMLAATALDGGGTPSDTPEQQHNTPPLPLGGGGSLSDTAGQQHGGPPDSNISVVGGPRDEGGGFLHGWRIEYCIRKII